MVEVFSAQLPLMLDQWLWLNIVVVQIVVFVVQDILTVIIVINLEELALMQCHLCMLLHDFEL
jgi:hypothetical protein